MAPMVKILAEDAGDQRLELFVASGRMALLARIAEAERSGAEHIPSAN